MQLIWVSGPTDRVLTVSITRHKVLTTLGLVAGALLLLGGVFHMIGLRIAVDHAPVLTHRLVGVASIQAQQRMEADYRNQLNELQRQLTHTLDRLHQLESSRQVFFSRIGLAALAAPVIPSGGGGAGLGGPFKIPEDWQTEPRALPQGLSDVSLRLDVVRHSVEQTLQEWQGQLDMLNTLPLAWPLQSEFLLSSTFGIRPDPLTHLPSMHEGLDFVAPAGTPVVVTAPGVVRQASFNGAYGNMVEVDHAGGFVTRYAHLKAMTVQPGQRLRTGDRVGLVGSTGRSTGPHLHYEVLYRGQAMHPFKALEVWSFTQHRGDTHVR